MQCRSRILFVLLTALAEATTQSVLAAPGSDEPIICSVQVDSVLHSRFPPRNLFDGQRADPSSRWASSRAEVPHWVMIKLPSPVLLDAMVVYGHDDAWGLALADATVQLPDGDAWKTVASVRDNRQARVEFSWEAAETDAIRLFISRTRVA